MPSDDFRQTKAWKNEDFESVAQDLMLRSVVQAVRLSFKEKPAEQFLDGAYAIAIAYLDEFRKELVRVGGSPSTDDIHFIRVAEVERATIRIKDTLFKLGY